MRFRLIIPVLLTLLAQRMLGMPGMPPWAAEVLLPMAWIVAAALLQKEHGWPYQALVIGLAWDVLFEPVIGPGGIAWSAACLALYAFAGLVADRSPKAWVGFGLIGAAIVTLVHRAALVPLGLPFSLTLGHWLRLVAFTGLWCGLVGAILKLDFPGQWQAYRSRKLR
ncbi:MAG: hypothetical protein QNL88_10580 [Acidobacteriota bacterium]|nr:hypothetical protein [Acidobacteriota bacterium]